MHTHLYFVRHAHSAYTPDELARPLSARGMKDAERVTELLQNKDIDIVVSSPYKRALQTIEGIARYIDKEIIKMEGFRERKLMEGAAPDFQAAIEKVWTYDDFAWEGGESNQAAQKRGVAAASHLLNLYQGKSIAVGTHGNMMVLIMNYFDTKYGFEFWKELAMPDIYKLTFNRHKFIKTERVWRGE